MSLKAFGKSAIIYSVGTIVARLAMFILIPIYTHYLTLNEYGLLSILLLTIQLLSRIIDFGLLKSLMRFVPEYSQKNKEGELVGSALFLNFISGVVIVIVSIIVLPYFFQNFLNIQNSLFLLSLTSIAALTQSIGINFISYFRAQNDPKWYTVLSSLTALFTLFLGFSFIVILRLGIPGALYSYILSYSIIIVITLIRLSSKIKFTYAKHTFKILVNYGFPLIFARSGDLIVSLSAFSFLGYFVNVGEVGVYNLGLKIANILSLVLVLPFQLALEPYVFSNIENKDIKANISKIATYLLLTFFIFSFLLIFIAPDLINFLAPPEYRKSYFVVIFLLPISLFQGFNYLGQSLIHINKKSKITGTIIGSMTLISILVNYFLIKAFGLYGILFSINIYYLFTAILLFYFGQKEFSIKLQKNRLFTLSIVYLTAIGLIVAFRNIQPFIYYLLSPIILILIISGFYKFNFFDLKEKFFIQALLNKINIRIRTLFT